MTQWMQQCLQDCDGPERNRLCKAWLLTWHTDKIHEERFGNEIAKPVAQNLTEMLQTVRALES